MTPLFQLIYILIIATVCQIVGWRLKVPSILLLLIAGILSGPVFHLLSPDQIFGPVLMPFVGLAVGVILFEGGLSLNKTELGSIGPVVLRLVSLAVLITWVLLSTAAYFLLDLSGPVSTLLGAILVISGPTVVIPLLRSIRARTPIEPILRWEGILIDPIGVVLAVLVTEVFESGIKFSTPWHLVTGILSSLSVGGFFGWIGTVILKRTVGKHLVSDQFIVPLCLSVLFGLVELSNAMHDQSGLITAVIMGVFVASTKESWVQTVEDFIGHTQRMFIGALFIILAARLSSHDVHYFDFRLVLFIVITILLIRPVAVFLSTIGTSLSWREKLAISSLAPRGIVSAALASSLGASLIETGIPGIEAIVPYTFATIIGTVGFYGIASPWLFNIFGARQSATEGVLFVGGGQITLALGKVLQQEGFKVAFVDTSVRNIRRLRTAGLKAYAGSILSDSIQEEIDIEGIGNLIAFTANDEANSLAAVEFRHLFGSAHVFQVALFQSEHLMVGGRVFGDKELYLETIEELWSQGYRILCRDVPKNTAKDQPKNQEPKVETDNKEYLLAEIEDSELFIFSRDNLRRAPKPDKVIVFSSKRK